jgi:Domain of unknown function (DUF3883)
MIAVTELERNVRSIISQVISERLWPSYQLVVGVLLQRYGVKDLCELLQPQQVIPVLSALLELNTKVDLIVTAFIASARSISTLADCEEAAVCTLRSFCMPPLHTRPTLATDRNYIPLDEDESEGAEDAAADKPPSEFRDYGMGPLHRHPRVAAFFELQGSSELRRDKLATAVDVLAALVEFRGPSPSVLTEADLQNFAAQLRVKWGVESLCEAGVALRAGALLCREELLFIRHMEAARQRSFAAAAEALTRPPSTKTDVKKEQQQQQQQQQQQHKEEEEREEMEIAQAKKRVRTAPLEVKLTMSRPDQAAWDGSIAASYGPAQLAGLCVAMPWAVLPERTGSVGQDTFLGALSASSSAEVHRAVGRWGEALVFNLLLQEHPGAEVKWVNEKEETRSPYDIILTLPASGAGCGPRAVFVEVKTTRFPSLNVFEISSAEWDFASRDDGSRFRLYRVFSAGCPERVRVSAVLDFKRAMEAGALRLCLGMA